MILTVTGHRPEKLGGWAVPNPVYLAVREAMDKQLMELNPSMVITGMALGVDQWVAELCIANDIPFTAAIPFYDFSSKWPPHAQIRFKQLCAQAAKVHVVTPTHSYTPDLLQTRNKWMVKNCDHILGVWDGSNGGTKNCIEYAYSLKRTVQILELPKGVWEQAAKIFHTIQYNKQGSWAPPPPSINKLKFKGDKNKNGPDDVPAPADPFVAAFSEALKIVPLPMGDSFSMGTQVPTDGVKWLSKKDDTWEKKKKEYENKAEKQAQQAHQQHILALAKKVAIENLFKGEISEEVLQYTVKSLTGSEASYLLEDKQVVEEYISECNKVSGGLSIGEIIGEEIYNNLHGKPKYLPGKATIKASFLKVDKKEEPIVNPLLPRRKIELD